jgi:hypothetical protein
MPAGFDAVLKAIEHVTTPIGLVAFLATISLWIFSLFVKEGKGLEHLYNLFSDKITKDNFYQLARLFIGRVFWLLLIIVVLSFGTWCLGVYLDHVAPQKIPAEAPKQSAENGDEPSPPGSYPQVESIRDLPSKAVVSANPPVPPEKVVFRYRNQTDRPLKLLLFDCYYHYFPVQKPFAPQTAWRIWDFPATSKFQVFDRFRRGTGWYVFFVKELDNPDRFYELNSKMIFDTEQPTLSVRATGRKEQPYEAVFSSFQ